MLETLCPLISSCRKIAYFSFKRIKKTGRSQTYVTFDHFLWPAGKKVAIPAQFTNTSPEEVNKSL
jgi:hypothetical protein